MVIADARASLKDIKEKSLKLKNDKISTNSRIDKFI